MHRYFTVEKARKLVEHTISNAELAHLSEKMFDRLVKAVVDVERGIMIVDASMHADEEFFLLENGSAGEIVRYSGEQQLMFIRREYTCRNTSAEFLRNPVSLQEH